MNHLNTDKRPWISVCEYVDIETGEILTKSEFIRNYYTIKNEKDTDFKNANYRISIIRKIGRKHGQQSLFGTTN